MLENEKSKPCYIFVMCYTKGIKEAHLSNYILSSWSIFQNLKIGIY